MFLLTFIETIIHDSYVYRYERSHNYSTIYLLNINYPLSRFILKQFRQNYINETVQKGKTLLLN